MDVKQAAKKAKKYLLGLYSDEELTNVGLEEVEFENSTGVGDALFCLVTG